MPKAEKQIGRRKSISSREQEKEGRRIHVMEAVRIFGSIQFILGFLLVFFAFYCIYLHVGGHNSGTIPYYAGAHIAGIAVLLHSLISVVIYSRGQHIRTTCLEMMAVTSVRPCMFVFIAAAPFVAISCVVGTAVTTAYGVCAVNCSYDSTQRFDFNNGMSIFLVILEIMAFVVSVASFIVLLKFSKHFGVNVKRSLSQLVGMHDGTPDPCAVTEADLSNLQKWRLGVESEVNFPKIEQYLDESRPIEDPAVSIATSVSVIES